MTPWEKYIETAASVTEVTRKRAEAIVKNLVKQGEVAADRAEKTVDELLKRFPDWEVDHANATFYAHDDNRGWESLPIVTP